MPDTGTAAATFDAADKRVTHVVTNKFADRVAHNITVEVTDKVSKYPNPDALADVDNADPTGGKRVSHARAIELPDPIADRLTHPIADRFTDCLAVKSPNDVANRSAHHIEK